LISAQRELVQVSKALMFKEVEVWLLNLYQKKLALNENRSQFHDVALLRPSLNKEN
jgi:predicted neuraminidase